MHFKTPLLKVTHARLALTLKASVDEISSPS